MTEGSHSTAFPTFPQAEFVLPDFVSQESTDVRNAKEMQCTAQRGLLDSGRFERWPVQLGDMAFFSQATMVRELLRR